MSSVAAARGFSNGCGSFGSFGSFYLRNCAVNLFLNASSEGSSHYFVVSGARIKRKPFLRGVMVPFHSPFTIHR
jgi:hypothetical protein